MRQKTNENDLYEELSYAAKARAAGRKSRIWLAVVSTALAALIIPLPIAIGWLLIVLINQIGDKVVFTRLSQASERAIPLGRALLQAKIFIAISSTVYISLGFALWSLGGIEGKLYAFILFNASLVHSSIFLSRATFLKPASISPFVLMLLGLPLYSYFGDHSMTLGGFTAVFGAVVLSLITSVKAYSWVEQTFIEQISAKKAAEREAEKVECANAQLRAVNQALDNHALVTKSTPEGIFLSVNEAYCEKSQYTRKELIGKNHKMLDTGFHPPELFEKIQSYILAGKVWTGQIQNRAKDGTIYWGDTTISPIKNGDGKIIECISIRRDITDLLEAREQAERANQAKSEFLAMMSHELRTPMNAVLGMASLLNASDLDDQPREYITALTDGGELLMTVLNDILDLSKIEAGKLEMETIDVDVRHAIKRLERLWAPNAEDKGLKFTCTIDDSVPSVIRGDITRIRQIIYNLLSNAVKFTEEGEVSLNVSAEAIDGKSSRLAFAVKDTGVGISKEAQSRLFTSFEQADKSVTRKFGGTGLGLAISKKLAQLMGGDINICSKPGKGACFTFTLEAKIITNETLKEKTEAAPKPKTKKDNKSKTSLRILAAEDNALNQRVLKAFLQPFNYDVVFANDGVEAMEYLDTQVFDMILMDVQMPRKDGLTTTQELRALDGPNANIPIIAMTANAMSGDRQKCLDAGMTDYVPKPIDPRVLLTAIARASTQKTSNDKPQERISARA
jgi:PAS domain S-box-containing protein